MIRNSKQNESELHNNMTGKNDWKISFQLNHKCLCENFKNSKKIILVYHTERNQKWLMGFDIIVKNSTLSKAIEKATEFATRLTNLIICETRKYNSPILIAFSSLDNRYKENIDKITDNSIDVTISVDFTDEKLYSKLQNNSRLNQQLAYYARGIKAYEENDPVTMIKEFYQVFDEQKMKRRINMYKPLRDILNHPRITNKNTIEKLRIRFPSLELTTRKGKTYLDITSKRNLLKIREIGEHLKKDAWFHIWKINV